MVAHSGLEYEYRLYRWQLWFCSANGYKPIFNDPKLGEKNHDIGALLFSVGLCRRGKWNDYTMGSHGNESFQEIDVGTRRLPEFTVAIDVQ
ncbi:hypothetical protein D1872_286670 [compost metagenome]